MEDWHRIDTQCQRILWLDHSISAWCTNGYHNVDYHPTDFDYRPVEIIFELIHVLNHWELIPVVFTGFGVLGIGPVMNRGGMVHNP
eukprot:2742829-Amphidinium_carterae.1